MKISVAFTMTTAARFDFPEFAHLARTVLADHEIEAFVFDENIVQLNWAYSYAVGGVRLVVSPEDHAEAVKVLQSCARVEMDGKYEVLDIPAGHLIAFFLTFFVGPCLIFGRQKYFVDPETNRIYSYKPKD